MNSMKFILSEDVTKKFPESSIGCLVIKDIDNTKAQDETYQILWHEIETKAKEFKAAELTQIPEVKEWTGAFETAELDPIENDPSHKALLERVINRQEIPNINSLVNIYNAVSIRHILPIGGHDLDNIEGEIIVGPNTKSLPFIEMNTQEETPVPKEEFVYADATHVLTRKWVWRQSDTSKTTEDTSNILIPIDDLGSRSPEQIKEIAIETWSLIKKYLSDNSTKAYFGIVDKKNNSIDLDELEELKETKENAIHTQPVKKDQELIQNITDRAVEEVIPSKELLVNMLNSGRRLRVYQGFDPTAPTLHIGHTAGMRKLRYFQMLGHHVIFLIGDFTGRIGDPTDKSAARQKLTKEQVEKNLKLYKEQASRILDFDDKKNPVEILFNSHWLDKLQFADILEIASEFTVQQMIKRDMFQKRLEDEKPIFLHEFMYPLMQGYDSVEMNIDIEVGGNDQMFNMARGRDLVLSYLNKEKVVLPNKLLTDPTGTKMGKTEGNMIMLSDSPEDMYGKVMAWTDGLIVPAYEILTEVSMEEIEQMQTDMEEEKVNPMELKKKLAYTITAEHKGKDAAKKAQEYFESVYQGKGGPGSTEIQEFKVDKESIGIIELLTDVTGFAESNSQAKRLVSQGAVSVVDEKVQDVGAEIIISEGGITIRAGKKIGKVVKK